jgi:hypothetical protein
LQKIQRAARRATPALTCTAGGRLPYGLGVENLLPARPLTHFLALAEVKVWLADARLSLQLPPCSWSSRTEPAVALTEPALHPDRRRCPRPAAAAGGWISTAARLAVGVGMSVSRAIVF